MENLKRHLYELACMYAESEKKSIELVSRKKGVSIGNFVQEYLSNGYSYLAHHGEVDMKFLKFHLSKREFRQLNPRLVEYFTKCINEQMERYLNYHQEAC